jgi:hypothetical protein
MATTRGTSFGLFNDASFTQLQIVESMTGAGSAPQIRLDVISTVLGALSEATASIIGSLSPLVISLFLAPFVILLVFSFVSHHIRKGHERLATRIGVGMSAGWAACSGRSSP